MLECFLIIAYISVGLSILGYYSKYNNFKSHKLFVTGVFFFAYFWPILIILVPIDGLIKFFVLLKSKNQNDNSLE